MRYLRSTSLFLCLGVAAAADPVVIGGGSYAPADAGVIDGDVRVVDADGREDVHAGEGHSFFQHASQTFDTGIFFPASTPACAVAFACWTMVHTLRQEGVSHLPRIGFGFSF